MSPTVARDVELNEAFAAQSLVCLKELNLHPIGCSATRIVVTLLYEMQKRQALVGLAALCVGGGMGFAVIVERGWYF